MPKPYQISIRAMFVVIALLGVTVWLVVGLFHNDWLNHHLDDGRSFCEFFAAGTALGAILGAAIGSFFGRPILFAIIVAELTELGILAFLFFGVMRALGRYG
jgi:hypothetical protein